MHAQGVLADARHTAELAAHKAEAQAAAAHATEAAAQRRADELERAKVWVVMIMIHVNSWYLLSL
jgi:hypothetical protein